MKDRNLTAWVIILIVALWAQPSHGLDVKQVGDGFTPQAERVYFAATYGLRGICDDNTISFDR